MVEKYMFVGERQMSGSPDEIIPKRAARGQRNDLKRCFLLGLAVVSICFSTLAHGHDTAMLRLPDGPPVLEVRGALTRGNRDGAASFDMEMLKALPAVQLETTTAVTDGVRHFAGFLMRDLLDLVGAQGSTIKARALNDYAIDIDIGDFDRFDVVVAYEMDGEALLPSDKGPLWIVYPRDQHTELQDIRYDYRWVWQLRWLDIE